MVNSAIKREPSETEYREHAWIDTGRNIGMDGRTLNRFHLVGDRFLLEAGFVVEVCETFDGFDYRSDKPVHCFHTLPVCRHCKQTLRLQDVGHYRGQFDSSCINSNR
jgi:hypothetical protein